MDGRVMRRGIIGSCQSAATSQIVKALLDTSLTHVSSAIASTQPLPLPLPLHRPFRPIRQLTLMQYNMTMIICPTAVT